MGRINSQDNLIRLIGQYRNLVFSICLKMTGDYFAAEDLMQETFLAAYRHWNQFDGQAEKAWICRIAANKCTDYCRAGAKRMIPASEEDLPEQEDRTAADPLREVMNRELLEELERCCRKLPQAYQETARMHFLEGRSSAQIAEQTGENINTVKTRLRRARELLKKSFRKEMLQE